MDSPRTHWITSGAIALVAGVFGFVLGVQFIPSRISLDFERMAEADARNIAKVVYAVAADQPRLTIEELLGHEEKSCTPTFKLDKYEVRIERQFVAFCTVKSEGVNDFRVTVRLTNGTTHTLHSTNSAARR